MPAASAVQGRRGSTHMLCCTIGPFRRSKPADCRALPGAALPLLATPLVLSVAATPARSGGGRGGRRPPYGHWRGGDRSARRTGFVPMGYRARMVVPHQDARPQVSFSPAPPALPPLIFLGPPAPRHLAAEPAPPSSAPSAAALAEEAGKNPLVPERALAPPAAAAAAASASEALAEAKKKPFLHKSSLVPLAAAAAAASAEKTLLMSETAAAAATVVAAQRAADSEGEDAWGGDPAPISKWRALARPNRLGKEAMRRADRFLVEVADNNLSHNVS